MDIRKKVLLFFLYLPLNVFCSEDVILNLNILVYNTHGLPEIFLDDNPKMRFPIIGEKTQAVSYTHLTLPTILLV